MCACVCGNQVNKEEKKRYTLSVNRHPSFSAGVKKKTDERGKKCTRTHTNLETNLNMRSANETDRFSMI